MREAQRPGYAQLHDAKGGLFYFGWDATRDRLFGWEDLQGNWTGHMDYFVNEFRGPATFVAARFGLPVDAIRNLGFKIKSSRTSGQGTLFTLAPWEGSAFQSLSWGSRSTEFEEPELASDPRQFRLHRVGFGDPEGSAGLPLGVLHGGRD